MEISVICTVKNGEAMLEETVKSIIDQTFTNWEFIIVNDGSTDHTSAMLNTLANKDSRIKIIETTGIGRAKALNLAIQSAAGKYLANIDIDDPSHPMRLEIQYNTFQNQPSYACLFTESLFLWEDEKPNWKHPDIGYKDLPIEDVSDVLYKYNPLNHSSFFIERKLLQSIGKYDDTRESLLDYELWLRINRLGYKIGNIKVQLSSKRIHGNQSFESKKRIRYLKAIRELKITNTKILKYAVFYKTLADMGFIYGLLPQMFRSKIKKTYKAIKVE